MPRSYISQILCFPSSNPRISEVLRDGLAGTLGDVPYLASRIMARAHPKGSVALSSPCDSLSDLFHVNTYTDVDYDALQTGAFRPSVFDGRSWFSADVGPGNTSPSPVFRAVLTLVKGGCLLAVSLHHQTADITAYGSLLKIWASHCKTGSSESIGFDPSWLDRTAIVRSSHDAPADTPLLLHKEESLPSSQPSKPAKLETQYLRFSGEYLKRLKAEVNRQLPDGTAWVSTSDVLTALLWGYIIHSEFLDDNITADGNLFMRIAVNSRSRYEPPLPKEYLGSSFGVTLVTAKKADLVAIGSSTEQKVFTPEIANVAAAVRQSINMIREPAMNRIVSHLAAQDDVSSLKLCEQAADVSIVSWADEGVYELDWGAELGHCEAARLSSLKGKRYPVVFPRLPNGDLEVLVAFDEELMNKWQNAHERSPWKA